MSEALDKVDELRDAIKTPTTDDEEWFSKLEHDIKKREQYQNFLDHPITKEIVEKVVSWIKDANGKLLTGKGDEKTIVRRDNLLDLLTIFSPSRAKTDHLVKEMDLKIKEFNEYYGTK